MGMDSRVIQSNNAFIGSKCFSLLIIPIDLATLFLIDFIWNNICLYMQVKGGLNNLIFSIGFQMLKI